MASRSWLTLALPENLAKPSTSTRIVSKNGLRSPTSCLGVQETNIDMRVILQFFEFVRHIVSDEGQGQLIIFFS